VRLLANENVLGGLVRALRDLGHDVAWIAEDAPGAPDLSVLARARAESRVLLTFDKDFGELACRSALPAECGVNLLRLRRIDPTSDRDRALRALLQREDYRGLFALVEDDRIRVRPLDPGG
jgi:predicted nuclease of predicted toxin-antitoxin system